LVAFTVGTEPTSWAGFAEGVVWYASGRWPLAAILALVGLILAITVVMAVVIYGSRTSLRQDEDQEAAREREGRMRDQEQLIHRARRRLDMELCRARPVMEQVIDVLLGVPVDLGANGLSLEPGPMVVEVSLIVGKDQLPVTTMAPPLYEGVLRQLRMMARIRETGEGKLRLHSSKRVDKIQVDLKSVPSGICARLALAGEATGRFPVTRSDDRRPDSVVFRLEPPPLRDVVTGEIPIQPPMEEHDTMDRGSGLLSGFDPSAEREVAPLVSTRRREITSLESWLRLALASTALLLVLILFWEAYLWGVARLVAGSGVPPWREVAVEVDSAPVSGRVSIQDTFRGNTPLSTSEPCRGRTVKILVQASGYATWQWEGLCPKEGPLQLQARLQPLR
jgi:hypothetical protein